MTATQRGDGSGRQLQRHRHGVLGRHDCQGGSGLNGACDRMSAAHDVVRASRCTGHDAVIVQGVHTENAEQHREHGNEQRRLALTAVFRPGAHALDGSQTAIRSRTTGWSTSSARAT